jgi:hypothetical protein
MSKAPNMDSSWTNGRSLPFDLFDQPFRILGVDPATATRQIHEAFAIAHERRLASEDALDALVSARDALLDPSRRLPHELRYPIDSPLDEVEALYAMLSNDHASTNELLLHANRLAPVSRANFLAHVAAHRPADSALLSAIIAAHVGIEATEVYEYLKAQRRTGGYPPPSLASVNQGLQDLLDTHAEAAIAGFRTSEDAIEPMLACTQQLLALDRYHNDILGSVLSAYRQSIGQLQSTRFKQIAWACEALQTPPPNPFLLDALQKALREWASLCGPLIAFNVHHGVREQGLEIPTAPVRALMAHLAARQQYDVALKVAILGRDALSSMPTVADQIEQDRFLIERELLDARMKPLEDFIDGFHGDFGLLNQALKKDGFGPKATGAARGLWAVFVQVVKATDPRKAAEPWMLVRDLAIHLSHNVGDAAAASALIEGLIHYGRNVFALPAILDTLRDDLHLTKDEHRNGESNPARLARKRSLRLAIVALATCCAIAAYLGFDRARLWIGTLARPYGETGSMATEAEVMPAVGAEQHYSLGNVRYCHFQEERLRTMKREAQGAEDIRAFNLLAVDYNSRCSDFFYQESDLATVTAEVAANRQRLAAEAERIMSTWPGHTSTSSAQSAK